MSDKLIAFSKGNIKALENGVIEGYLVYFSENGERDLTGEYFTKETEFHIDKGYPVEGLRVLYNHGLDKTVGIRAIGKTIKSRIDDVGIWIQAQLDMRDEYEKAIYELTKNNKLGWSSGALVQSVEFGTDKHIKSWAIIEASLTPQPAMPEKTQVLVKSFKEYEDSMQNENVENIIKMEVSSEVAALLQALVETLNNELGNATANVDMEAVEEEIIEEASQMVSEEIFTDDEEMKMEDEEKIEELIKKSVQSVFTAHAQKFMNKAVSAIQQKRQKSVNSYRNMASASLKTTPPVSPKLVAGGGNTRTNRVSVGENLKYAHLTPDEMALGLKMALAQYAPHLPEKAREKLPLKTLVDAGVLSDEYVRTMAHKNIQGMPSDTYHKDKFTNLDRIAMKSALPIKANELDATDITNQGAEWVSVFYDSRLWERARETTELFNKLVERGMVTSEIPQGTNAVNIKSNTSSPTVFTRNEANSLDVTGNPEITAQITPFGTAQIEKIAQQHVIASTVTHELEEDSIIDIAQFLNADMAQTLAEALESTLINGDTTATANTNINLIDGTPPTGLQKPAYLAWDGLRHQFLVDYTAQALDGAGALTTDMFNNTINAFPSAIKPRKNMMLFVIDSDTEYALRPLPDIKTRDVAGEQATLFTGTIPPLFGVEVYTSGLLGLSNATGKISATPANNTKGTIIAVYAPYWHYARKRNVTIETARDPLSGSTIFVGSIRHIFTSRGANAANGTYNITV